MNVLLCQAANRFLLRYFSFSISILIVTFVLNAYVRLALKSNDSTNEIESFHILARSRQSVVWRAWVSVCVKIRHTLRDRMCVIIDIK